MAKARKCLATFGQIQQKRIKSGRNQAGNLYCFIGVGWDWWVGSVVRTVGLLDFFQSDMRGLVQ